MNKQQGKIKKIPKTTHSFYFQKATCSPQKRFYRWRKSQISFIVPKSKYQIKVIFNFVFEGDRHLMCTLYPSNVVKALEETILAAFLGTATGRLIPAQCSALICQEYQSHGNFQGYGLLLVLLTGCSCVCCLGENQHTFLSVASESPASHTNLQNLLSEQDLCSHTKTTNFYSQHCTCSTTATNTCWKTNTSAALRANHISCFFPRPWKDF